MSKYFVVGSPKCVFTVRLNGFNVSLQLLKLTNNSFGSLLIISLLLNVLTLPKYTYRCRCVLAAENASNVSLCCTMTALLQPNQRRQGIQLLRCEPRRRSTPPSIRLMADAMKDVTLR